MGANIENLTLLAQLELPVQLLLSGFPISSTMLYPSTARNGTGNELNNVITGNSWDNVLAGMAGNDSLVGAEGNDTLDGGAGIDTLKGGIGNDSYYVDEAGDVIIENANEGTDTVLASFSYTLGANVESLTLIGSAITNGTGNADNNLITGNSADNVLDGLLGNDTLVGGAGADVLKGGVGNDSYFIDASDTVTELTNAGVDTVFADITYTLGVNLENLQLTGTNAINGIGNTQANVLTGNLAANLLNGGAGSDTLMGGLGNDIYSVGVGDIVVETSTLATEIDTVQSTLTYTLTANVENLILLGTGVINGTGNALANRLTGNTAANVLTGGLGNDTYVIGADDVVVETSTLSTEIDTVQSTVTYTLGDNLECLILSGTAAVNGTGNALNNTLKGNAASNMLDGGTGIDTMSGGTGDDYYVVDNTADVVIESGVGVDTVASSVSYVLSASVENLLLQGANAVNGTGNSVNNSIIGSEVDNLLDGGKGVDTLVGGLGNDTYVFNRGYGQDTVVENDNTSANSDVVQFGAAIASNQLWLGRQADNLEVSIIGTADKIIIKDWYLGADYHVEQFKNAAGKTLTDTNVENLVTAMAALTPPALGQTNLTTAQHTALDAVIAANWS